MTFHAIFRFYLCDYSKFPENFGLKVALNMSIKN